MWLSINSRIFLRHSFSFFNYSGVSSGFMKTRQLKFLSLKADFTTSSLLIRLSRFMRMVLGPFFGLYFSIRVTVQSRLSSTFR